MYDTKLLMTIAQQSPVKKSLQRIILLRIDSEKRTAAYILNIVVQPLRRYYC